MLPGFGSERYIYTPRGHARLPKITRFGSNCLKKKRGLGQGRYFGDQLGDSFCPSVVNWRTLEPSASIDQICLVPVRVDSNMMCRPSGAQLGRSLRPASRVSSTSAWVAISIT